MPLLTFFSPLKGRKILPSLAGLCVLTEAKMVVIISARYRLVFKSIPFPKQAK